LCHAPVVLFDQVVQVLARSDQHSLREFACRLPFPDCAMRGNLGVQRDLRRFAPVLHCMAEKGLAAFTARFRLNRKSTLRPALSIARYR
jgi:hypothetical protein